MDHHRNDILLQDIKTKLDLKLNVVDPESRLYLKGYFRSEGEIHCARFDKDDTLLAFGSSNGNAYVYDLQKSIDIVDVGEKTAFYSYSTTKSQLRAPCNNMRWLASDKSAKQRTILVTSNTDGTIMFKNVRTDQTVATFKEEEENEIYAMDLNKQVMATCGKDSKVRIYDVETQQLQLNLSALQWAQPGHNNRLFSVKLNQQDKNMVISGGWDQNVNIWDLRTKNVVGCILGPKICGDSIDIKDGVVLTGANRMNEQLQLWDLGTQKLIENVRWDKKTESAGAFIYGAQFSKAKLNAIGGVAHGTNELKLFDSQKGTHQECIAINGFTKGLYAIDFANISNRCVIGGGDGVGLLLAMIQNQNE